MANPQREHGFTATANELAEAEIKYPLPKRARQIYDTVKRLTYGYRRTQCTITLSEFAKYTGIGIAHINRAINLCIKLQRITKNGDSRSKKGATYSIQKDYEKWITKNGESRQSPKMVKQITKNGESHIIEKKILKKEDTYASITKNGDKLDRFDRAWKAYDFDSRFPDLDREFYHRTIRNWVQDNPSKKNYTRFITNWLNAELRRGPKLKQEANAYEIYQRVQKRVQQRRISGDAQDSADGVQYDHGTE